jgi:hypothetical protein
MADWLVMHWFIRVAVLRRGPQLPALWSDLRVFFSFPQYFFDLGQASQMPCQHEQQVG